MAVLQFRFDESYDQRFMSIGGWLAEEDEWKRLEASWQNCINRLNFRNRLDQQITRFHATYMNRLADEFKNWDASMSANFGEKLTGFIGRRRMAAFCIGCDMEALKSVFPAGDPKSQPNAYSLCIKVAMVEIGHVMRENLPDDQVLIVHDHGNWDNEAIAAYNAMVDDENWESRNVFVGITSLTGKQCVGLQAADLIAFEAHKALRGKLVYDNSTMRKAMKSINSKGVPGVAKYLDKEAIQALKNVMRESGKYPNLDHGGLI